MWRILRFILFGLVVFIVLAGALLFYFVYTPAPARPHLSGVVAKGTIAVGGSTPAKGKAKSESTRYPASAKRSASASSTDTIWLTPRSAIVTPKSLSMRAMVVGCG